MIYMITYILGQLLGVILYRADPGSGLIRALLSANLIFCVGSFGIINFVGHTFLSRRIAQTIGWVSNGFQKELGFVSFGIGICGILSYWFRDGFQIATAIIFSAFLLGAGIIHIIEIRKQKNFKPGNVWIILPDLAMPLTLITLLVLQKG